MDPSNRAGFSSDDCTPVADPRALARYGIDVLFYDSNLFCGTSVVVHFRKPRFNDKILSEKTDHVFIHMLRHQIDPRSPIRTK